ncbi:PadR family transcriptional regulator [[Eubacterium] cellulosolvens]
MSNVQKFKNKIEREMKSGFIALLLLYIINNSREDIYGYKIIRELNEATQGKLKFPEGTVYPILRYLQSQHFLTSYLGESPNGAPRKYYTITNQGKSALREGLESWQELRVVLTGIIKRLEVR